MMEFLNKYERAEKAYADFMTAVLGKGWGRDPNAVETPKRVARMFIDELTVGLHSDEPKVTFFDNVDSYSGMVKSTNIEIKSMCSHHHVPFVGVARIAYIPGKKIIGLSKLNRIADHFARRPQVQENLTQQIHDYLDHKLEGNLGVAVHIKARHLCVGVRGVNQNSEMETAVLSGYFFNNDIGTRDEFYK